MESERRSGFTHRPWPLRMLITACVLAAVVLPVLLSAVTGANVAHAEPVTAAALLALSVINVEIGRILDGGVKHSHRPHKALSAWAFAGALLLPSWWLIPVVVMIYAHARWRGMRVQLWKWVGSAAYVTLAALAAGVTAAWLHGPEPAWIAGGPRGLLTITAAAAVFLLVETVLFHGSAYLNDADDEAWLRRTLAGPRFYVTEAAMLFVGGLSAAVWATNPWLLPLMLPAYGLAQQAALSDPLREQAATDAKTGVYRYESWRSLALAERDRCTAKQQPWAVVFADLDQFKPYNDTWGHLAGDNALAAVADVLRARLRGRDLVGRFGGEEFSMFLSHTTVAEAGEIAERLRVALASMPMPDTGASVTVSIGVAGVNPGSGDVDLARAISQADKALYLAKDEGRDRVHVLVVTPDRSSPYPRQGAVPASPTSTFRAS
jgi:diguanylate cyclase (GGDEF)-like protein